jgi:hypothetical protein
MSLVVELLVCVCELVLLVVTNVLAIGALLPCALAGGIAGETNMLARIIIRTKAREALL